MKRLDFWKYQNNAIKEGLKTSTIQKYCDLQVGECFKLNDLEYNGIFKVTSINRININEITNEIALKVGYTYKSLLQQEVKKTYKSTNNSELFYQINFKKVG